MEKFAPAHGDRKQTFVMSTEFFDQIGAMTKIGGWELDLGTNQLLWSRETYHLHDLDPEIPTPLEFAVSFYSPEDQPKVLRMVQAGMDHGTAWDYELPLTTAKGRKIWVRGQGRAVWVDQRLAKLVGSFQDITARRQSERSLVESEEKYRLTFQNTSELIFCLNLDGTYRFVNEAYCRYANRNPEELVGKTPWDIFPPDQTEQRKASFQRVLTTGTKDVAQFQFLASDGSAQTFESTLDPLLDPHGICTGVLGFSRDVTHRFQAEQLAEERDFVLQQFMDSLGVMQGVVEVLGPEEVRHLTDNRVAAEVLGLTPEAMKNKLGSELGQSKALLKLWVDHYGESLRLHAPVRFEYSNTRDQKISWHLATLSPLKSSQTGRHQFAYTIQDITERKEMEASLRQSEEHYRQLFQSMTEMFQVIELIYDQDGKAIDYIYRQVNPAFEKLVNKTKDQLVNHRVKEIFAIVEDRWLEAYSRVATTGVPENFVDYGAELDKHYDTNIWKVNDKEVGIIFTDITERKKAEEALRNIQKLESLGVLAGGIAHDFNNLMGGLFGYIEIARLESQDEGVQETLSKAMKSMEKARALTSQLLTFAKGGAPLLKPQPLVPLIQEAVQFALGGTNVSCQFEIPSDLWTCNFDKNQIWQVISNLFNNAQQAMPLGGTVELMAQNLVLANHSHPTLAGGNYVKISLMDFGIGIPKNLIPHIFDPFFTTKSKGHGLGLTTSFSILRRHGGGIEVESEPGKGCRFHVYLPATPETILPLPLIDAPFQGNGTILIMDDEEIILETLRRFLESLGFQVISTRHGREAIDRYRSETKAGTPIVGLIFDLTVQGGMGGKEAVEEIRNEAPKIPIFVMSGYFNNPVMEDPGRFGFTASLSKPFQKFELAELLRHHLKARN